MESVELQEKLAQQDKFRKFLRKSESNTIDGILEDLGEIYKADRAYVFEDDFAKGISVNTYEWCAEGVIPQIDNLKNLSLEDISEVEKVIENGEYVIHSLKDELKEDDPVYQILAPQQIESLILAPLIINDKVSGYIGVDNPRENEELGLLLTIIASVICTKLLMQRTLAENDESYTVLSELRGEFATLYFVDFTTDYIHTYKSNDSYESKYGNTANYSRSMGHYVNCDISEKDRERMVKCTSPTYVMERFKKEKSFVLDFEETSFGDMRYCQLIYIKANEEGTHAVVCGRDVTKEKKEEMELQKKIHQQFQVIAALGSEYENIFLINLVTKEFEQYYKNDSDIHSEPLKIMEIYEDYEGALKEYIHRFVVKEDVPYFLEHTTTESFLKETPEVGIRSLNYRRIVGDSYEHYQLNSAKFMSEDHIPYLVLGFRNVNAIVEEEERKSAYLAEMQDIIYSANMGVWHIGLVDGKKPTMIADQKMKELLGIDNKDLTPEETYEFWFSRITPDAVESVLNSVEKMKQGYIDENTYLWNHPTLQERYVRCGGSAKPIEGGYELRGYHYDVDDMVREQIKQSQLVKEALQTARHANKAKTTFLNNVSHDIRTPMNAIVGYTALAASHISNTAQVQDYLSKIAISSNHLLSLINDVLDMSRIESGKVTIDKKEVHLPDVMHDIRTITQANINAKQLDFYIDTVDVIHEDVICDKLRLDQVLLNILNNATKFTKPGDSVSVRVIERPCSIKNYACYEFHIKDTGIGMSEDFQQHIFEPFTREHSSTVSGTPGTGLGMAISKNIIDMMGGTIEVKSKLGQGTEFIVTVEFEVANKQVKYEPLPELQGIRALVADDHSDTAINVSNMLKSIGLRSDWTLSGKEAVLRAKVAYQEKDDYGVYIIDWMMPDMNGIETVRQIRRHIDEDVPIIILTAYDWADIEEEAKEAGVTDFVSKPLFLSELRDVLSKPFRKVEVKEETSIEDKKYEGVNILLVEDNKMNQEIAVELLSEYGFTVDIASNGKQAVEMMASCKEDKYDFILMDIQMPIMDGYEATQEIRKLDNKNANIPIIAMTANAFEEDKGLAKKAGMDHYITKPIDVKKLLNTINQFLDK